MNKFKISTRLFVLLGILIAMLLIRPRGLFSAGVASARRLTG